MLALPRSVWDSWQPFLGAPELEQEALGLQRLKVDGAMPEPPLNSYICVFDLDSESDAAISPVEIETFIRVSPERMAHHAFTQVPATILHAIQSGDSVLSRIRARLTVWWPTFAPGPRPARRPKKR